MLGRLERELDGEGRAFAFLGLKTDAPAVLFDYFFTQFHFTSSTWGNSTSTTDSTQAVVLEIEGNVKSTLTIKINEQDFDIPITEILEASLGHYLGGFLTGAFHVGRFIAEEEYTKIINLTDIDDGNREDFYYVRVAQRNKPLV